MDEATKKRMQESLMRGDAADEMLEAAEVKAATLLNDCLEGLSRESVPARMECLVTKITACLTVLKLIRDEHADK
jgi:hypothetical protein